MTAQAPSQVLTFGCRLNASESQVIARHVAASGDPDLVVVNSCAVTAEAVRQARQQIRRVKRERPGARIVVTGCAAQIEPASFAAMPEVARVVGNVEKLRAESFSGVGSGSAGAAEVAVQDIMGVRETAAHLLDGFADRARAFVEVQTGCDHRCTFCIIPYGRGNSRSVPADAVAEQVRRLVDAGMAEIVLTGVDLTSWGSDLGGKARLGSLVRRILDAVPSLGRLRLSSIDGVEADPELLELITGEPRLMPHLHLSLQAGDNLILKRMKRRHSREDAIRLCASIQDRRPDVAFGADLIAGFPTEDDAMFENSLALVEECNLVFTHVFPYSARPGTPAARMPQVPVPVRKERASRLRQAGSARQARWLQAQVGQPARLLVEREDGSGHGENFAPARVLGGAVPGTIVAGTVTGVSDGVLDVVPA
jgi:threonylcarbamoyladenosine tRNA methylthiotransferase MtaB